MIYNNEKIEQTYADLYFTVMKDVLIEKQGKYSVVNFTMKTITDRLRLTWVLFYIKYINPIILLLSVIFLLIGIPVIATEKGPSFQILTSLAGFVGGLFTVIAVILAAKEYFLFNAHRGIKEYRAFIVTKIRPINDMLLSDYAILKVYLINYLANEHTINDADINKALKELLEMSNKYQNLVNDISSEFNDISYHNNFLRLKSRGDFYSLQSRLHNFSSAIQDVYLHYAPFANVELKRDNAFISDCLVEKHDHIPQSLVKVLKLLKKIDEDKIFN
ncbi:hypothetical protein [Pseudoalteromonas lipolytica]|uniref:SMODS and SLOG-associating 2TM effector domain-containing protein n=1 Tax=Pseudoalteromonas lipolytica TaxID=570156 RepID=A0ABY1GBP5_9GAMM|nr:hypothetical protein [Pseudoalteromonas lipolytica]MBE0350906.1 hypothetical protein [Pseudoalteromonas lipolytica LMEB 39]SFT32366.1 hypothetical protein SAMN04487854_10123 [Pseudoalteromonas lipolytica]